jgi:Transposase DDE domain
MVMFNVTHTQRRPRMAIIAATLARIKSDPLALLGGAGRVNQCFAAAGHVWRDRVLDPAHTMKLFILQVLHGNTAISHLPHLSDCRVADSSYCQARARLPVAGVAAVVTQLCGQGGQCVQDAARWLGRRVLMADATTAATPDLPALQKLWPQPSAQKPGCGSPIIKLLGLLDLATGMILHLTLMSLQVHEFSQLAGMHAALAAGDVLLGDRAFCSFAHLAMLAGASVDAVFRVHQRQIIDFTPGRAHRGKARKKYQRGIPSSRFVRRLGQEDQLVDWVAPKNQPAWMSDAQFAALPKTLRLRELRYHVTVQGRRTRVVTIATTLLDPIAFPKPEIAKLYGLRWEIETNFRHLKTTMGMEQLKCQTVEGVLKELMVFVLVYNLVRRVMTLAAARQGVGDANRISFIDTMRWIRSLLVANPTREMPDLIVNAPRPGRWCPRVKKRRMKEHDLMTRPRSEYSAPQGVTEDKG